jgi:ribosome biogenesis GTPase A
MREYYLFKKALNNVDLALEIVDSRFILDSTIKKAEELVKKKEIPFALIINKSDLLDKKDINYLEKKLRSKGYLPFFVSARKRLGTKKVREWLGFLRKKINKEKGKEKIEGVVFGYPNVGKSSFLNVLKGKSSAGTSSIPGFTKGIQYLRINKWLRFIDTPGLFFPLDLRKKALLGIINPNADPQDLIDSLWYLIIELKEMKYGLIELEKYGFKKEELKNINDWDYFLKLIEKKAKEMNYKIKSDKADLGRFAKKIIVDWQKGKIKAYKLY